MNIENAIPAPLVKQPKKTGPAYDMYNKMEIGDSVFFPFYENAKKVLSVVKTIRHRYYKEQQFTHRVEENGIRFWRINKS